MKYGVDVSKYQDPARPDGVHTWAQLAQLGCEFAMVRATYGTSRDSRAVEHVRQIRQLRSTGIQLGLYLFFRHDQLVTDQIAAFCSQALACGLQVGDLAPAIDIEQDGPHGEALHPGWVPALEALVSGLVALFGACFVYETQAGFSQLGKPGALLSVPQWVAHYTGAPSPAAPGSGPWAMWQHRVGPFVVDGPGGVYTPDGRPWKPGMPGPGPIDQSRAHELVLCTRVPGATGSTPPPPDGAEPEHSHAELVGQRLDSAVADLYAGLGDLSRSGREVEDYEEEATVPDGQKPVG